MRNCLFFISLLLTFSNAQASVVVGATRVIFDGAKESTVVGVDNKDNTTNIVQSRLSVVDTSSPVKDAFIITPPLFRLNTGEKGFVRIVRSGKPLPTDRESMLWLNVKGIPAMDNVPDKKIRCSLPLTLKIKFIYRPKRTTGPNTRKTMRINYNGAAIAIFIVL